LLLLRAAARGVQIYTCKSNSGYPESFDWVLEAPEAELFDENQVRTALVSVRHVQRVDTIGGVAPSTGCDSAHAGAKTRVGYSATYDFYGTR
jgi:hypothetical protein